MAKPCLRRDIQLIPTVMDGKQMVVIMDPLNLTHNSVALDQGILPLLRILDGSNDFRDIQTILMRQRGGTLVPLSEIEAFINKLDEHLLLESNHFNERIAALYEEFNSRPDRPPSHAGKCYDPDPKMLSLFIDSREKGLSGDIPDYCETTITGLVAPHIDIAVAADTYVDLYRRLRGKAYDLVIIFGINHQWQDSLYSLSEKNYVTPFGTLETDRDFIGRLKKKLPRGTLATDDFGHRHEHSVEFQTIFLHHYFYPSPPRIVPILCGGIHEFIINGENIFDDERFRAMGDVLENLIDENGRRVLLVAAVDLSHIGLKFGHRTPAASMLSATRANDRKIIDALEAGTPEAIFDNAVEHQDHYQVCGLPSLLIVSYLLRGCRGTLLAHETYDEQATQSAVTYASMIFTGAKNDASRRHSEPEQEF
jgi:AmmeMemoRadiSam system protein B